MGTTDAEDEPLLTVQDVCRWFAVTRDWVYDEVEAGRLPYLRLGRKHLRFRRAELQAYLDSRIRQHAQRTVHRPPPPWGGAPP